MKLSDFSGGLNIRKDPTLISENEAVTYANIDNAKGNLTSTKDFTVVKPEKSLGKWFYLFNNKWYDSLVEREYLEYKNNLYYTERDNKARKVVNDVVKELGIAAPPTKLTTVINPVGSLTGPDMVLPPGNGTDVSFSPSGDHVAVGSVTSPFLILYKTANGNLTKLDDPASMPGSAVTGVSYSKSGQYLAVSMTASPYILIYKRSGDTYVKLTDPVTLPTGQANALNWSSDETYLTVAHAVSPFITIYKRAGDVFTKLANPASLPAGVGQDVVFSSDTTYMAVAHTTTPFVTIYKRAADVFTKLANPAVLPAGDALSIDFSLDGTYLSVGLAVSPYICTYSRAVDVFTKLADPANLPAGAANSIHYSNNYNYLAVAHDTTPFVTYYKRTGNVLAKITNPGTLPTGNGKGVGFTPDDAYAAVVHDTTPFISLYRREGDSFNYYNTSATLQYVYTYYDSSEGVESAPSPVSDELAITNGTSVDISGFVASSNTSVDFYRLYRIGADVTEFTLIVEIAAGTTSMNDNTPTLDAIGTLLDSANNLQPPVGLRYLIEAYGYLFGVKGNNLYYSDVGSPDYWPGFNVIEFPREITGIVAIPEGIVVFDITGSHVLLGTSPETFRKVVFNHAYGCRSNATIKYTKQTLLWEDVDGICALTGGTIVVISKDKLGKTDFKAVAAAVYDEQYHLILPDGSVFILDVRFNGCFKYLQYEKSQVLNLGEFDNIFYGVIDGKLSTIETGLMIPLYYDSPRLTDGEISNRKVYNDIYIRADGQFMVDIYIDGEFNNTNEIDGNDTFKLTPKQEEQAGFDIQFKIQGIGIIYEIEYKVQGRENGR